VAGLPGSRKTPSLHAARTGRRLRQAAAEARLAGNGALDHQRTHGRANVTADDVAALLKQFADAGFASADSAYVDGSAHCGQYHTDGPQVIMAALVGPQLKSVHIDTG